MTINDFKYCVAIRTLGQAGQKYQQELDSLAAQTLKPEKILVYLAEGYALPQETIGSEIVIRVPKGMVAQRALTYDEVTTPFVLLLDDDVYLAPDAVEKMALGLLENQGDCIAADTFPNHLMSLKSKLRAFLTNWVYPHYSSEWAIKIHHTGFFSYNSNPVKSVYRTMSAAGPCSLWRLQSFRSIHVEDEKWLDRLGFAYGDDLLYFYKLHINGGKVLMHYKTGVIHLDAQSTRANYNADSEKLRKRARAWFLIWWRTDYNIQSATRWHRMKSLSVFLFKYIWGIVLHVAYSLFSMNFRPILCFIQGNADGYRFVQSDAYKNIPNFIVSKL